MATTKKNITKKTATKATSKVNKLNNSLVNASMAAINTTVENGEKWQKLTKKLIKQSEPIRTKQMNMIFETATAVKNQATSGKERMMDLVGYDGTTVDKAVKYAKNNPVSKKVISTAEGVIEKVTENPMVKKVEKTTDGIKKMSIAKFNDVKEDVLEQAQKILHRGEEIVEDAKAPKKTSKQVKAKGAAKVKAVRKTTTKKTTVAKKATAKKVKAVKETAKAIVKEVKAQGTDKVADIKETGKEKVAEVKTATKKAVKTIAKDDLKIIHGIGPKLEGVFNKNGINTYGELAKVDATKIEAILDEAGPVFKNIDTKDWKKQAEVGAEGGEEALKTWVARYRTV
ncbi:hypothetical protein ULMS_24800 [Patiriisocius marinistellae]|uniref:Uncharacterized protein n=1 Tax=Patiriisocius marinistellae TaxID=2494560 RepID=A0A5J4G096_9FLAO|nr:hypothetical protein [Patiriisocius marinistellae]GEQ86972.1 hypothetical protein ULMS_24800 [Patiriisocius marinistellae]